MVDICFREKHRILKIILEPPSAPVSIEYRVNNTELNVWWKKPESDGGRNDLTYRYLFLWKKILEIEQNVL